MSTPTVTKRIPYSTVLLETFKMDFLTEGSQFA